ncbi:MAG TPA: AMP-binding protein, partial [Thermoanaerobaculia bacterium]
MSAPHHRCLHELVAAQAARTPRAEAVAFAGSSLTYRELDRAANRLAQRLRRLGAGPEAIIAVALERSLELPVALLAALKAGAAYLPLDPGYPRERLAFMLDESRAAVVLTAERLLPALPGAGGAPVLCLDREEPALAGEPDAAPAALAVPGNLAYVLYTSGSTGRPKGVAVPHAAIVNHMLWLARRFALGPADRVLQKTPFSFDASVWEFYAPWLAGGALVVARPGGHQDAAYLVETLRRERITILQVVPSLLRLLAEQPGLEDCRSLRLLFCGGEPLPRE